MLTAAKKQMRMNTEVGRNPINADQVISWRETGTNSGYVAILILKLPKMIIQAVYNRV